MGLTELNSCTYLYYTSLDDKKLYAKSNGLYPH